MTYPYAAFPSYDEWATDSGVSGFGYATWRMSDPTLGLIDSLVKHYNDPNYATVQIETLFYLVNACSYWLKKLNKTPGNTGEPLDNITGANLPATKKVDGHVDRRTAISALKLVAGELLAAHTHTGSLAESLDALELVYGKASNGGNGADGGNDDVSIQAMIRAGESWVFLRQAHLQRRYKLRFRGGVAWRWKQGVGTNVMFDTTDNVESETADGKTHFVMNTRGHIFAGFNVQATWFKHSSLIGGANAYCAGRMRMEAGKAVLVENDSGHYHPGVQQMRNLVQRLRLYGQSIDGLTIRRYNTTPKVDFTAAQILASKGNLWPDNVAG